MISCKAMTLSHLLQMRGLKQTRCHNDECEHKVASFTDAWIETEEAILAGKANEVASFTDAWIETHMKLHLEKEEVSHLLQMRGLKPEYA